MTESIDRIDGALRLTDEQYTDVMRMAACGLSPRGIAAALELESRDAAVFVSMADTPGSIVAKAIEAGVANGLAKPMIKLHEAAQAGNIEAIRELSKSQARNRFNELLSNMDDDELAL